jgi:hypothetical protein
MMNDPEKWGFRPPKSGVIDLDKGDFSLYREVAMQHVLSRQMA